MKKFVTLFVFSVLLSTGLFAQAIITKAEYNRINQSAVVNEYPFDQDVTEGAIVAKMKSLGYSSKSSKGYNVFRMVKLQELGSETYDLYFKYDRKSRKEKDKSIVTLLLSPGYDNFVNDTTGTPVLTKAKEFLDGLFATIAAYDLEKQISSQEESVKKAEKRYNSSVDDGTDLEKRKRKLENDIEENKKDQSNKKAEAETQRQVLETLKSKRGKF
jgi:hypothetical protein